MATKKLTKKEKKSVLYSVKKSKTPSSFKSTCFGFLKNLFKGGVLNEEDRSKVFFYLPSSVDQSEEINKYMTSVYLRLPIVKIADLGGKNVNPSSSFDRDAVVKFMKRVADESSQNLRRNVDGFLSKKKHNNTLIWPGGKRVVSDKFALTY